MRTIKYEKSFKKDYKRIVKRGYDIRLFEIVVSMLANNETLPEKHRDHSLNGKYSGFRECHITPDWLLIYRMDNSKLILILTRTGTHSDLF